MELQSLSGKVIIDKPSTFAIKLGFRNVNIFSDKTDRGSFVNHGTIIFHGKCNIGKGAKICCSKDGILEFGDNFVNTAKLTVVCAKHIRFGKENLVSWNVTIMDNDTHILEMDGKRINDNYDILFGEKVWIGCESMILKGAVIPDNSVIAAKTLVTRKHFTSNVIIAGHDREVKSGIEWSI